MIDPPLTAVVLAAGEGTRLRPLTLDRPKPMVPLADVPALEYVFGWLKHYGVRDICVNLHYRPEAITGYFGDGARLGLRLHYNYEPVMLGTAGGAAQFRARLSEPFLLVYGDVLTDLDLAALVRRHLETNAVATLALYRVPDPWTRGVVDLDADGRIAGFREKPPREQCAPDALVNTGISVLARRTLDQVPAGHVCDFGHDVFPAMLAAGERLTGWRPDDAYVLDYGTLEQYRQADADVRAGRLRVYAGGLLR